MIRKVLNRLFKECLKNKLKKRGVIIQKGVIFNRNSVFEDNCKLHRNVCFKDSYLGTGSYVGWNSLLNKVKIGRFCCIAPNVEIVYGQHPIGLNVSSSPVFYSIDGNQTGFTFSKEQLFDEFYYADEDKKFSVVIGNDVWIGYKALIMEGVKIGDGAIIGAGAVVTKDVEAYGIYVGVPAKLIRKRFDDDKINALNKFAWWDKDFSWLSDNVSLMNNIDVFMGSQKND